MSRTLAPRSEPARQAGPAGVLVQPDDTEESLSARILVEEHRLYPEAVRLFAEGRLAIVGRRVIVR